MHGGPDRSGSDLGTAGGPGPTKITRRTALPSGRAVIGAALVAVSVVGLFASYRSAQSQPTTAYVVVARTVAAGQPLTAGDLATRTLDLSDDIAVVTMSDREDAIGAVARVNLMPGQLLQTAMIIDPASVEAADAASFEISLSLDRDRAVDGSLERGEVVDLLATLDDHGIACTSVVVAGARVVNLSGADTDLLSGRSGALTVTLSIPDPGDVLAATFASDRADITIVRSSHGRSADYGTDSGPDGEPGTTMAGRHCAGDIGEPR